ncbi:hypothetical protein J1605_012017 [Eschrichtius robustus]|uniref:Small ribosomal subunit protein uS10m n=1 Tax=Eschrichtius robustus TaxID=9764 RepID=A0AB34GIH1_ESCRO|nr:hypothetical protein J1605_012017 [Eschrichtius robustus]
MVRGLLRDPGSDPGKRERQDGGASGVWATGTASLAGFEEFFCMQFQEQYSQKWWPSSITVSDEPDTLYKRLSVLVKGHDKAVLDSYEYFAVLAAKELGISVKVQYNHVQHTVLLLTVHMFGQCETSRLEHLTGSTADVYLEYIQRNLPEGVAMDVTKTKLEQLPEHIKKPIWETIPEEEESKS